MQIADIAYKPYVHPTNGEIDPKKIYRYRKKHLVGYQEITCYFFDIKLNSNFNHKAHFVGDGSKTKAPKSLTTLLFFQHSPHIVFLAASLNNIDLSACDISRMYLNSLYGKKVLFEAHPECWENTGKLMVVTRAIYNLKSSAKSLRMFCALSIKKIGYKPWMTDPNVYMKDKCTKDGREYWCQNKWLLYRTSVFFRFEAEKYASTVVQKAIILKWLLLTDTSVISNKSHPLRVNKGLYPYIHCI